MRRHRIAAMAQDDSRLLVIPVVDDFLQHIDIGARWDGVEKASGYDLGAWQDTFCTRLRHLNAGGKVKEHTGDARVAPENCRQKLPMAATDVDDLRKRPEIVSFGDCFVAA